MEFELNDWQKKFDNKDFINNIRYNYQILLLVQYKNKTLYSLQGVRNKKRSNNKIVKIKISSKELKYKNINSLFKCNNINSLYYDWEYSEKEKMKFKEDYEYFINIDNNSLIVPHLESPYFLNENMLKPLEVTNIQLTQKKELYKDYNIYNSKTNSFYKVNFPYKYNLATIDRLRTIEDKSYISKVNWNSKKNMYFFEYFDLSNILNPKSWEHRVGEILINEYYNKNMVLLKVDVYYKGNLVYKEIR